MIMSRSIGTIVLAMVLLLALTSVDGYAQRGFHRGAAPVVTTAPAAAVPQFVGRPIAVARPPVVVAPFVSSPVGAFGRAPHFPRGNGNTVIVRQPRTIIIPQPFGIYPSY